MTPERWHQVWGYIVTYAPDAGWMILGALIWATFISVRRHQAYKIWLANRLYKQAIAPDVEFTRNGQSMPAPPIQRPPPPPGSPYASNPQTDQSAFLRDMR